jgi:class 3 adenylate cyclase/tetratricopeptide (TPR) repeat protein
MTTWVCANCGGENPTGMKFCGHCGTPMVAPAPDSEQDVADALRSFVAGPVADKLVEAGGTLPEERRLITALFADVSGFTSLADRLDPEQLLEVIDPVISGLSSVVGRYGGYVEKFAGDALMALFGAPVSHDDDAARALRVALEMHSELARLVGDLPHQAELTLHVGVNSGHGIARILGSEARMDYAVLGDSVILAQRLESAAPPGETYVSEATVRLVEGEFEFAPVGELTLKGKAEPVLAWRLLGVREEVTGTREGVLVGREKELQLIDAAVRELKEGRGRILAVTGDAGVGKSRIALATRDRASEIGAVWLPARCLSYGSGVPYWPYLDLLRRFAELRTEERPDETRMRLARQLADAGVAETAPFFARLLGLPVEDDDVAGLEPEAFRRGLHASFTSWLGAMAAVSPTVLALEDLHWADPSSLELTAELVRLSSDRPLLVVLVGRPEAQEQIEAMTAELDGDSITLGPLQRDAIAALVTEVLGGRAPDELVGFIEERTSGNPFFVEELVRALDERDVLVQSDQGLRIRPGWDARELPPTIEGVLASRIDLLSREAAGLLQTASVIGRRVQLPLLSAVVGDRAVDEPVEELVRSRFLERTSEGGIATVVFHHALVQDAAYSRLLRREQRRLHLLVAEVAEALYGSSDHVLDLLARHLYLGEAGEKAVVYLVRAGERARRLFANDEAILHLQRAGELAPDDDEIRLALANLLELVGRYGEALELYRVTRERTADVRAWRGLAATYRKRGEYVYALSTVDEAFSADELKGADLTPLWLEAGWTLYLSSLIEQAADVLNAGIEAAVEPASPTLGHLYAHLARAEILDDHGAEALTHALRAQALLEELDDLPGLASAIRVTGDAYRALGRVDEATATLGQGLELAERIGSVEEIGGCLINLGLAELQRGAHAEAIAYNRRAIEEFERIGHGSGRAIAYSNLAWALTQAGVYDEALVACEEARTIARSIGHPLTLAETTDTMALADLRQNNFTSAAARAEEAAALFVELGAGRRAAESLELAAEAWGKAGDEERARDALDRARPLATQLSS